MKIYNVNLQISTAVRNMTPDSGDVFETLSNGYNNPTKDLHVVSNILHMFREERAAHLFLSSHLKIQANE